jgi:regulator of sigma E protease
MTFLAVIAFILIIGLLIFVHELGHFIAAKKCGVLVEEFAIGFPPRLYSFKRGETTYSLNAIPLGGYTKMLGEEDPSNPRSFATKSKKKRLLILSAGSGMNAILPLFLFALAFMIPSQVTVGDVMVQDVAGGSPAYEAGIEKGDEILSIAGHEVENLRDVSYYTQLNLGKNIPIVLERAGESEKTVWLTPRWNYPEGQGPIGIEMEWPMPKAHTITRSYPPWQAIPMSGQTYGDTLILMKNGVLSWFIGGTAPEVVGPVGIFQITSMVTAAGFCALLRLAAFISINLAIINMLPIPALDGGRIAFVLLEAVRGGKRISPRTERLAHLIGFALLIILIIVVSFNDISRLIQGGVP